MSRLDELDALFHRLHQESVDRYERKLQLSIEEKARQVQAASERQAKELPQIARLLDVPVDAITTPGFSDEAAHNRQLAELRPVLTNRPSRQAADAKQFSQHSALTLPGARTIPIYATSISAAAPEHIAEIPGVRGNPWVLPWNPGHITIRRQVLDTDYGLCGKARILSPDYHPLDAEVWFAFHSDVTAVWNLMIFANFHGFYVLNAT